MFAKIAIFSEISETLPYKLFIIQCIISFASSITGNLHVLIYEDRGRSTRRCDVIDRSEQGKSAYAGRNVTEVLKQQRRGMKASNRQIQTAHSWFNDKI